MTRSWRPLVCAAAFNITIGVGAAAAQTVFVRNAPPGGQVEVVVDSAKAGSGTADAGGEAQVPFNLREHIGKDEMDANVYVDVCGTLRRVLVVDSARTPPPPESGCDRSQIPGLYWVRQVNTIVVDAGGTTPKLLLIKGHYTPPKPSDSGEEGGHVWRPSPTGMVVYGAGSLASFRDAVLIACGTVQDCSGKGMRPAFAAGATFWITRVIGADVSYVRPAKLTASGSGTGYRFNNTLDAELVTVEGKVGIPVGPVRIYGQAGMNHHQATSSTSETIDDVTVTVGDTTQTFKGGTQTFATETKGWSWVFGGGLEAWVKPSIAIYGEFGLAKAKGDAVGGGAGQLDDRVTLVFAGMKFRIGPK
jgi:hypothetical protein